MIKGVQKLCIDIIVLFISIDSDHFSLLVVHHIQLFFSLDVQSTMRAYRITSNAECSVPKSYQIPHTLPKGNKYWWILPETMVIIRKLFLQTPHMEYQQFVEWRKLVCVCVCVCKFCRFVCLLYWFKCSILLYGYGTFSGLHG